MLTVALALLVAQASPLKVAAPDFVFVGLEERLGSVFQERFVSRLGSPQLKVTSQRDIQQLLSMERQRELLGCDTGASQCIAELAGALGVEVIVNGSIAKSESGFIVTLRALQSSDGQTLATPNARVSSEAALLDWLDASAESLREELLMKLRPSTRSPSSVGRWVPALVGGALLIGGGVCLGISGGNYLWLRGPNPPELTAIRGVSQTGQTLLPVGAVLAGVGVVGVVTSLVWVAVAPKAAQSVSVSAVPLHQGAVVTLGGNF